MTTRNRNPRRGAALVEAAIVLPVMIVMIGIAIDYSRVVYSSVTLSGSSRNAAMYEFDPFSYQESNYTNYSAAAQADATNLMNNVTFSKSSATTMSGVTTVTINSNSTFKFLSSWLFLPKEKNLQRTVVVRQAQLTPD
jgi:Flp pilus assembly protein TadG